MAHEYLVKILWEQNRRMTVLVLTLLLMNVGAYLLQSSFLDEQLTDLRTEVLGRQQSLRKLQQQKNAGSMPVTAVTKVENELTQFLKMIPPEKELSVFIGDLFKFASNSKLDIKQISYNPKYDEDVDLLSYALKFSVTGQYRQLKKFIYLLEMAERILIISDISLAGGQSSKGKKGEVTLQIQVKTFFREDNK